ncbi:hypothetical protein CISG_05661 [Coccidioides immitis RMSCC 3703]|uniref:Predicted protein n=3 Tax=Coccidioides TaxID=5500 RepID=E9D4Y1_COCPS|nr:predicted protein [Coccidioides posadasii str. Silveira]KMP00358.1 hypothetical protein CIRG_00501 [Coccidioides immitis RMSCC 2394]KMU76829.1 hypothetical protein CISG_05661 [Coccidioides immitis RMSCC 3703]
MNKQRSEYLLSKARIERRRILGSWEGFWRAGSVVRRKLLCFLLSWTSQCQATKRNSRRPSLLARGDDGEVEAQALQEQSGRGWAGDGRREKGEAVGRRTSRLERRARESERRWRDAKKRIFVAWQAGLPPQMVT